MTQEAKKIILNDDSGSPNLAFVDGVKKYALSVRDLDIDMIDRINPFGEAMSILAKTMNEDSLKAVQNIIAGKKAKLSFDEARDLTIRAVKFKKERGRAPKIDAVDPWEKRMAEGVAAFADHKRTGANRG